MENNSENKDGRQERVVVPTVVTIGGQQFSVTETPEIKNLIDLVRKDASIIERNKIYPKIQRLQEEYEALSRAEIVNPSGNVQDKGVIDIIEAKFNLLSETLTKKFEPLLKSVAEQSADSLEKYRAELLQKYDGQVVPEMVVGDTKEELDANLNSALKVADSFKKMFGVTSHEEQMAAQRSGAGANEPIRTTAVPEVKAPETSTTTNTTTVENKPEQPATTVAQEPVKVTVLPSAPANTEVNTERHITNIKEMSMEEFARKRQELGKELASLTGQN